MKATARRILGVTLLGLAAASPVTAQDWGQMATISSTMGVNAGRLCVGEGTRADIGCPTYAPSVSSGGLLTATALSATTLNGNYASFTTLSAGNVSFTGNLSIEGVTFANGGIELEGSITGDTVTATTVNGHYASFTTLTAGAFNGGTFNGDGSGLTGVTAASTDRIVSGTSRIIANNNSYISVTVNGVDVARFNQSQGAVFGASGALNSGYWAGSSVSTTAMFLRNGDSFLNVRSLDNAGTAGIAFNGAGYRGAIYGTAGYHIYVTPNDEYGKANVIFLPTRNTNGMSVGIGTASPQATLQVSGSFTVSTTGQTTSPSLYVNTSGNVGIGTNNPTANLYVSGSMRVNSPDSYGYELYRNGTHLGGLRGTSAYINVFDAANAGIALANSAGIPRLFAASTDNIGIGTVNPVTKLEVNGAISATALYVTATTGTISGTTINGNYASFTTLTAGTFYGDGSGLTGVTAASSDRITSGTTNVVANGNSGYVSFTSAGSTTGYYSPGGIFAAVGISTSSNQASFTTVYASGNVGIGGTTSAVNNNPLYVTSPYDVTNFMVEATGISGNSAFELLAPLSTATTNGKAFSIRASGETYARGLFYTDGSIGMGPGTSTRDVFLSRSGANTLRISSDRNTGAGSLQVTGRVAVATTAPSATAHVSGTLMVAGGTGSETCSADYAGLMRRNPTTGRLQTCR